MGAGRWDWLYERQPQPLKAWVLDQVARELARAVEEFPPHVEEWERPEQRARFEPVFEAVRGRPGSGPVRLALRLLRLEIARDYEQIDRIMTGGEADGLAAPGLQHELAVFLWQHWLDQVLAFGEFAQGKFRRAELAGLVDRLEARLLGRLKDEG